MGVPAGQPPKTKTTLSDYKGALSRIDPSRIATNPAYESSEGTGGHCIPSSRFKYHMDQKNKQRAQCGARAAPPAAGRAGGCGGCSGGADEDASRRQRMARPRPAAGPPAVLVTAAAGLTGQTTGPYTQFDRSNAVKHPV